MRKFITLALMAATVIPAAASAQSNRELQRDRQEIREETRDLRQAQRYGDRRDIRDARGEVREARQEYREDLRDRNRNWGRNDWRGYRDRNRNLYARGSWRAPFRYQQFRVGGRIAPTYFGRSYWINDPWRYRLPRIVRPNQRWIRHYNDVVLIDYRRGIVLDRIGGFFW